MRRVGAATLRTQIVLQLLPGDQDRPVYPIPLRLPRARLPPGPAARGYAQRQAGSELVAGAPEFRGLKGILDGARFKFRTPT